MNGAPYQKGSDTSAQAAGSIEHCLSFLEKEVLQAIKESREIGMNCWEVEQRCDISRACSSARLNGLRVKGLIHDTKLRRATDTGRSAVVYRYSKVRIEQLGLI